MFDYVEDRQKGVCLIKEEYVGISRESFRRTLLTASEFYERSYKLS